MQRNLHNSLRTSRKRKPKSEKIFWRRRIILLSSMFNDQSFVIRAFEGDNSIIVSLSSSYESILDNLPEDRQDIELIEISIIRESGSDTLTPNYLKSIVSGIIKAIEDSPSAVLYYFCEIDDTIPHIRNNRCISPQEYRNRLFEVLFNRYSKMCDEIWYDFPLIIDNNDTNKEIFIHLISREEQKSIIVSLFDAIRQNAQIIIEQK